MVEQLNQYLNQYATLSQADIDLLKQHTEFVKYKSGEVFIDTGSIAHKVGFLLSGVCRFYFYDRQGNEISAFFTKEGDFVTSLTSFFEFSPSSGTIKAEVDCEMLVISRKSWELFCKQIPSWNHTIKQITHQVLVKKTNFQRKLIHQDTKTSYLQFIAEYPTLIQRVPLVHIASYLGVTKFSLSRIRKQIASEAT